ncbi:MAG: hypothetical protein WB919_08385 [Candidatus Sulfotelmatobacter sp.]
MKLGTDNRKTVILAAVIGGVALLTLLYEFLPTSSTIASTETTSSSSSAPIAEPESVRPRPPGHHGAGSASDKKAPVPQNLDPTLQLQRLATIEQIKYEGSGRNIFVSQAEVVIPKPIAPGTVGPAGPKPYVPPAVMAPPPIPLKFFGFANQPGEAKKVFLSKGEDVFIAGEGEIVDRRYKVVRISPSSVEVQDVVGSGPPQSLPLTQG